MIAGCGPGYPLEQISEDLGRPVGALEKHKGTSNNDNFFVELIAGASRP
jgi:hypothetical protein